MLRRTEEILRGRGLNDFARIHEGHPVGDSREEREVVRDQKEREPALALQPLQFIEDLRLKRHVERRRGLVGDHDVGFGRKRHRNHRALLQAPREFMREGVEAPLGLGNACALEPLNGSRPSFTRSHFPVRPDHFHDLRANGHHRIEARCGLLKYERDPRAPEGAHFRFHQGEELRPVKINAPRRSPRIFGEKPHQSGGNHAFAAAGFTHKRERFAPLQIKRDMPHRMERSAFKRKVDGEVLYGEQRLFAHDSSFSFFSS